ncbi:MAG: MarR family transcriptional regulator [Xanthomonadales bacterium]|nr:MarR family transcriptional regulator [Xanthomonadales bacterium]
MSDNTQLQQDAEAFHQALSQLLRIYQYRDRDRICCHDISITQCHALELLVESGPLRSQALADALRLDKSTTTRVVDALVRKSYVKRQADPDDARARQLSVTAAGNALYQQINADLITQQAAILINLDPAIRQGATRLITELTLAAKQRFGTTEDCSRSNCCISD